jgi:acyl-CoA thioester hydrolase
MTTDRGPVTRVPILLRYRDMDEFGHLNQSLYHTFLEEARTAVVLEILGGGQLEFVLARVELDHRAEVRIADREVFAEAWIEHVGTSSLRLGARVVKADGTIAADGSAILVGWDAERRGARKLRDDERAKLLAARGTGAADAAGSAAPGAGS